MFGKSLERRLGEITRRIKEEKEELLIADHERRDSARQAENMENYCLKIKNEINRLENLQDKMLDKLTMEKNDGSSKSSYS